MTASAQATAEPLGTSRLHTSEPRWPAVRPSVDPTGHRHLLVHGGDERSTRSALLWEQEIAAAGTTLVPLGDASAEALAAHIESSPASTRLLVAGDECTIASAMAAALAGGLRPQEIRVHLTAPEGPRPVQCVHCRTITATTAPVDGTCPCNGCGVPLLIFPHFSRRIGAYLGFRIDAEEL